MKDYGQRNHKSKKDRHNAMAKRKIIQRDKQ